MQTVGCYHCGARAHRPYAEENGFSLVKCDDCGLLYVTPRPSDDEITAEMRSGLHRGDEVLDRVGHFIDDKVAGYQAVLTDLFAGWPPPTGRWLDVGCGHGELLVALQSRFDVTAIGLEPCLPKAEAARARGLDVAPSRDIAPGSLDALSSLNVFSHLPDPVESLRTWTRWLAPGGLLVLQTGDSARLPARHHHRPFDLPDHLSFASQRIVREILERVGMQVLRRRHYRHADIPGWQLWRRPYRDMWLLARRRHDTPPP